MAEEKSGDKRSRPDDSGDRPSKRNRIQIPTAFTAFVAKIKGRDEEHFQSLKTIAEMKHYIDTTKKIYAVALEIKRGYFVNVSTRRPNYVVNSARVGAFLKIKRQFIPQHLLKTWLIIRSLCKRSSALILFVIYLENQKLEFLDAVSKILGFTIKPADLEYFM